MSRLSWMADGKLTRILFATLERAQAASDEAEGRMKKNVIDPFSSLISAATFGVTEGNMLSSAQQAESASKGIASAVGSFHQQILGKVEGFRDHDAGYDLECASRQIIAEVKNKHNTMNAANRREVINELETAIRQKSGRWDAFLVIIIPKKPERYRKQIGKEIYEVDGASFYELATGSRTALHDLYYAVEDIITEGIYPEVLSKSVLEYCKTALLAGIPE